MLPTIEYTSYTLTVPSTQKQISFKRMTGKEEKLLLQAKESPDDIDGIYTAIKQIVYSLGNITDKLTTFDIEYLFLKIRQNSVDSVANINVYDPQDDKYYPVTVNLEEIEIEFPENLDIGSIEVENSNPPTSFTMHYPTDEMYNKNMMDGPIDQSVLISKCIDKIKIGDSLFVASSLSDDELLDFIVNMPITTRNKANEFLFNMPALKHEIKYKTDSGEERSLMLGGLSSFFSF